MMTALSQRRRNSHFFPGTASPLWRPRTPEVVIMGPGSKKKKKPQTSEANHLRAGKVWISPPASVKALDRGS